MLAIGLSTYCLNEFTPDKDSMCYYSHFTDEETEAPND